MISSSGKRPEIINFAYHEEHRANGTMNGIAAFGGTCIKTAVVVGRDDPPEELDRLIDAGIMGKTLPGRKVLYNGEVLLAVAAYEQGVVAVVSRNKVIWSTGDKPAQAEFGISSILSKPFTLGGIKFDELREFRVYSEGKSKPALPSDTSRKIAKLAVELHYLPQAFTLLHAKKPLEYKVTYLKEGICLVTDPDGKTIGGFDLDNDQVIPLEVTTPDSFPLAVEPYRQQVNGVLRGGRTTAYLNPKKMIIHLTREKTAQ